jgi:cyclopropane fatty-acyl-phospholipid synthase-like methyltransferase
MSNYERMEELYADGDLPWDDALPPPEVEEIAATLIPGRALDLGCGYGRSAIYLAQRGWQVDGIDFIPQAITEAEARANAAGVTDLARFHVASVADLDFLDGMYVFALDIGCMHALDEQELSRYAKGLRRLLRQDAVYLLFARLKQVEAESEEGPRGLPEAVIRALFAEGFELERYESGETAVPDQPVWSSAWFYFRRSG